MKNIELVCQAPKYVKMPLWVSLPCADSQT